MLTQPAAQALLDGLSAAGLGASTWVVARWGTASLLRSRLSFVFGGLCVFFAARAASGAIHSDALDVVQRLTACAMPLASLLLVEGMLRRHAPRLLKAFVAIGGLGVAIVVLVQGGRASASVVSLEAFVVLSLSSIVALVVVRDRTSLSRQENAALDALAGPGAFVALLSATDFVRSSPIGLSGVGAAMVAFVLAANPTSRREGRSVLAQLAAIVVVAAASEVAFGAALGLRSSAEDLRMGAVLLALLLATAAVLRAREVRARRDAAGFAAALTVADVSTLDVFLDGLADQPLLAGLRVAEGTQLTDYDQAVLGAELATRAVWTPSIVRDADASTSALGREELGDLMTRTEATHAVLLSREPLRIALLTLPGGGETGVAETDLALFGKLAAIAATECACA